MKKRLSAWLLSAALVFSLLPAARAADTVLTVRTPQTVPKAGESFEVSVEISGNPGLCVAQFTLDYDKDELECTEATMGEVTADMLGVTNPRADTGAILAAASLEPAEGDGKLGTFKFRAKRDVSALSFRLTDVMLIDANEASVSFTVNGAEVTESRPASSSGSSGSSGSASQGTAFAPSGSGTQTGSGAAATGESSQTAAGESAAQPASGTAQQTAVTYPDVDANGWAAEWIAKASQRGLFQGDEKGNFRPNDRISRGDFVLVLWRMAGQPEPAAAAPFADVPADKYYAKAVAWASEQGYVNGKGSGFAPQDSLTRQEAMKILFGYAGAKSGMELMLTDIYDSTFADSGEIASWAKPAMYWAYYEGIIGGMSATELAPQGTATRAQLAKILVGYLEKQ